MQKQKNHRITWNRLTKAIAEYIEAPKTYQIGEDVLILTLDGTFEARITGEARFSPSSQIPRYPILTDWDMDTVQASSIFRTVEELESSLKRWAKNPNKFR